MCIRDRAYEAQHLLADYLPAVWANAPLNKAYKLPNALHSPVSYTHLTLPTSELV